MIKLFLMDVDGTLTDGKIYIGDNGEVFKAFNSKDGMGIKLLQRSNIVPVIITGRKSKIVDIRAKELNITEVYQGIDDKLSLLEELMVKYNVSSSEIAYIGDDVNDLPIMLNVGTSFAPCDCSNELNRENIKILKSSGGNGAVREACEYIIERNAKK